MIQDEAIVCKHCGRDLVAQTPSTPVKVEVVKPKKKTSFATWGCLLFLALLVYLVFGVSSTGRHPASVLKEVSHQGVASFVLTTKEVAADRALLERQARLFCDVKGTPICQVMVWTDAKTVPTGFPMTDLQIDSQVAQYERNTNTGHDCFFLMEHGDRVKGSDSTGCR